MVVLVNEFEVEPAPTGYDIVVVPEVVDGRTIYVARHPELPRVLAQGDSVDEALEDLALVASEFIKDMHEAGIDVPAPHSSPRREILSVYAVAGSSESAEPFDIDWKLSRG
jgi:predicted RNase H-like HicB family nuclease